MISSKLSMFTTNFTTNSPQQLAPSCPILPRVQQKYTFYKSLETLAKQGLPGKNKEKQNNDKNTLCLPRHSSFMIMQTFTDWGNTGQNLVESLGITMI